MREHDLALVCLDMPQGFRSSMPPIAEVTNPALSVVRFHGRDPKAWEKKTVSERFRYLYKREELQEWVPKIERMAENAAEVHSLTNNCYSDHAVVNAWQLDAVLRGEDPDSAARQLRMQARQAEGQPGTPACNLNLRASP